MIMDEAWMNGFGGLVDWGVVLAEKFKLVVCGFGVEGRGGIGVDIEGGEEEKGNRRR